MSNIKTFAQILIILTSLLMTPYFSYAHTSEPNYESVESVSEYNSASGAAAGKWVCSIDSTAGNPTLGAMSLTVAGETKKIAQRNLEGRCSDLGYSDSRCQAARTKATCNEQLTSYN